MSSLEYQDLCRLCLVKDDVSVPIFEDVGDIHQICNKITTCLPVKVTKEDKLPQKLCNNCVYKVESFYQFWHQTLNVEKQLLQWLENAEKQGYSVGTVFNQSGMKDQSNENRLVGNVMQQVSIHQSNMNMDMDNMGVCMPMMMTGNNQQQITSVPMDTSGSSIQNIQAITGSNTQATHDQITQTQTNTSTQQEEEDESSEDEENSDDECDGDDGLPIKEESEEDPNNSRTIEPTTFVNVSLACEDPGPSGLQQQKMADIQEMAQATDVDPKTGVVNGNGYFLYGKESIRMLPWQIVDLEGHPYYAFLPASDIPKSAETSQCDDLKQYDSQVSEISIVKEEQEDCAIASDADDTACNDISDDYYSANVKHSTPSTKETAPAVGKNELDENALNENDDSKVYNCDECNTCFPVLRMLKQHWKTVHQGKAPQCKCSLCPAICRNPVALETHVDLEHRNERRKTDDGPASTDQPKTYRCEFCDHECDNKSALHSHISKKHPQILQPRNKPRDVKAAVEQEEYTCDTCGFKFPNRRRLKEHLERKHASGYKYNCEFCPKKFKVKSDMRLHVRFKHKENPIVCDVCGKTCANSNSLYVHQKWAHFKPKYECEICKRRMVSQENLDQHILLQHERKESFVCEECGKSFSENHRLKQHRLTHTGDRPYDCHICGRAFARRTAYRQHLLIHTGKRPYVCDICGKAFTQKPGLICHRKSHPGVHPPLPIVYIDHILNDFMKNK